MGLKRVAQNVGKTAGQLKKAEQKAKPKQTQSGGVAKKAANRAGQTVVYYANKANRAVNSGTGVSGKKVRPMVSKAPPKKTGLRQMAVKIAARPYFKAKKPRTWSDDVAQLERDKIVARIENYTNESKLKDDNSLSRLTEDAKPGSAYRMRNWINGRIRDYPEDRGSTLAQVKRLASLYGAVDPTTKGYTREQAGDLHRQIQNAPVNLQNLYIKYGEALSPMVNLGVGEEAVPPGTAYFKASTNRVYGDPREISENTELHRPYRTHWHEYGHNLDHLSGGNEYPKRKNYSFGGEKDIEQTIYGDVGTSLRDYWEKVRKDQTPYNPQKALTYLYMDMQGAYPYAHRNIGELSDIMSPYSVNNGGNSHPLGWGHDKEYWRKHPSNAPSEAFADFTSASVAGGDPLRFVQAVLPNSYDEYLKMLEQMARP